MIKVCKGNSGGENAILKRVYILPLKKVKNRSTVAVIFLSFAILSSFLWRRGGGIHHQGIRDKLKQSSFNAYGLLYQSFVVKKGESLSLIMRNDNLMKIPLCVLCLYLIHFWSSSLKERFLPV